MNLKEIFKNALPVISNSAPIVGNAIGGPFGVAASYIIPVLAHAFDGNLSDLPDLAQKIADDPNAPAKLTVIEQEHGSWITSLPNLVNELSSAELSIKLAFK